MNRGKHFLLLIGIILIGFALRLYQLDAAAFRGDEAFSVQRWTATPISESLSDIASLEPHPPLTYVLFRIWGLIFGTQSEFLLRMLPVLVNLMGIPAIYALGKRLSKQDSIALIAAFLWAIHPFQIWHAQDFRNYGVWAGLSVIVLWLALRVIHSKKRLLKEWIVYTVVALISCLIFYNELITIGVLGLYVLAMFHRERKFALQWSVLNGAIISITILAFLLFQNDLISSGEYAGTTGALQIEQWWQRFIPVLQFGDTLSVTLQQQFNPTTEWWLFITPLTIVLMIYVAIQRPKQSVFLLMVALIPLLVLGIISTRLFIFRPRYVMLAAPAYTLLVSYAIVLLWKNNFTKILSVVLAAIWLVFSGISLNNYYHNPAYAKSPDWRDLIGYLEENTQSDEIIIQTGVDAGFGFYYENADIPAGEFALPSNFSQPIDDVITGMENTAEQFDTIWITGRTFPDWQNAGVVEDWAFENLQLIREAEIASLPVRQFMSWDVQENEILDEPIAIFGDSIALAGMEILESDYTDTLTVLLYWQPIQQTDVPHTVFVHLVGGINPETGSPLWAQDDHPPQNGRVSTDLWLSDDIYRDVYTLSLEGVEVGDYQLYIGFYDPTNSERLLIENDADAYITETITIE